jgi:hypothetical protein
MRALKTTSHTFQGKGVSFIPGIVSVLHRRNSTFPFIPLKLGTALNKFDDKPPVFHI